MANAAEMVNVCYRHQHPEAYGRPEGVEATIPREVRYGAEETWLPGPALPEEPSGRPDAVPLDGYAPYA